MELKLRVDADVTLAGKGSNRTFMELKRERAARVRLSGSVLIVPLWN